MTDQEILDELNNLRTNLTGLSNRLEKVGLLIGECHGLAKVITSDAWVIQDAIEQDNS